MGNVTKISVRKIINLMITRGREIWGWHGGGIVCLCCWPRSL